MEAAGERMGGAVAHVELSLTEPVVASPAGALDRWAAAVNADQDLCLLLDADGAVVAASQPCLLLFGADHAPVTGRRFVDVVRLLDFTAAPGALTEWELDKIPPLFAISSGGLARGLLRVPTRDGATCTLDVIAAPLRDADGVVASISFLSVVSH
jgi:PAS domain-containing protein